VHRQLRCNEHPKIWKLAEQAVMNYSSQRSIQDVTKSMAVASFS
jgi:hypothetical protein